MYSCNCNHSHTDVARKRIAMRLAGAMRIKQEASGHNRRGLREPTSGRD